MTDAVERVPTVVITGASRGIGQRLASEYLKSGWRVVPTVRRICDGDLLAAEGADVVLLDVADQDSVEQLRIRLEGVPIDVVVNNAGVLGPMLQTSVEMDFAGFAETLAVNTLGPLRVAQALLSNLRAGHQPRLVNISSRMGSLSYAKSNNVAYRASKAALNKVTQCLATDLAPMGIAVAALHPGWVRTNIGGDDADLDVQTSAAGIRAVIDGLRLSTTGSFLNYDGADLAW